MSDRESPMHGRWRNELVPYGVAIMDALGPDHPAPIVVFKKSAQVSATQIGCNWIGWTISEDPTNMLLLSPTSSSGRKFVRTKLHPMFDTTPVLKPLHLTGRKSDQSMQIKEFPHGFLFVGSLGVADDLAMTSVARIMIDEVDRMPKPLEEEGDQVEIALRRGTTYGGRFKAFLNSTPTTEENSRIEPYWLMSTQDRYYVPCPDCGHMQYLRFDRLRWPEGKPKQARYACESCAVLFEERHKTDFLAAGEWRAEYPEREAEVKGFHINGLYTPIGLGDTWIQHAVAWDRAKGNPAKAQVFTNTRLGEIVKSTKERVEWQSLHSRREPYRLRTIPTGVLLLTCGVDIQHDRVEAQILGHGRGEAIVVIDYNVIYGDPTRDEVWAELDAYLAAEIMNEYRVRMRISATAIDSGNWQHEVTNFTRTRKLRHIFAAKGSSIVSRQPIGRPTLVDVNWRGGSWKRGAEQYQIGVSMLKTMLYRRLKADDDALPADRHVRFAEELPEEYFRQLAAETFDPKEGWIKTYDRNEALDSFVLAMAAAMHQSVQVHRLREVDWLRLDSMMQDASKKPVAMFGGFLPTPATKKD